MGRRRESVRHGATTSVVKERVEVAWSTSKGKVPSYSSNKGIGGVNEKRDTPNTQIVQ
jgi:hypothetical protein